MNAGKKGKFIVFEGIDGSGKSTQLDMFVKRLEHMGETCYVTKEPTDGPIGSTVNLVLKKRLQLDERATAALFAADRLDHLLNAYNGICSKSEQGVHVVCDRYYLSSYAYNGSFVSLEWVMKLNEQATQIMKPAAHIFVDVTPEVAVSRIVANRFETELYETTEQLKKVRTQFYQIFDLLKNQENIIIVDGSRSRQEISDEIWEKTKCFFE